MCQGLSWLNKADARAHTHTHTHTHKVISHSIGTRVGELVIDIKKPEGVLKIPVGVESKDQCQQ